MLKKEDLPRNFYSLYFQNLKSSCYNVNDDKYGPKEFNLAVKIITEVIKGF